MGVPDLLTCLLRNLYVGQVTTTGHLTGSKLGNEYDKAIYCYPAYLTYLECIIWNTRLENGQAGIKIIRRNSDNLRNADDTTPMVESEEELNNLLMRWKRRVKKLGWNSTLKKKKIKIMASSPITSWQIEWEKVEAVTVFLSLGSKNNCSRWMQPWN